MQDFILTHLVASVEVLRTRGKGFVWSGAELLEIGKIIGVTSISILNPGIRFSFQETTGQTPGNGSHGL